MHICSVCFCYHTHYSGCVDLDNETKHSSRNFQKCCPTLCKHDRVMPSDEHVISFRRIYLAIGQVAANLYFISIDMSQCNNTSTVHPSITSECTVHSLQIVYVLALAGILLVAIGLVLIRKCSSVMSRIISKRRRQRFVRNTASRSKLP